MLTLIIAVSPAFATDVLFVGNSYTNNNNLPATLSAVFEAAGSTATTGKLTAGGLNFANHADRARDTSTAWHTQLVTESDSREWVILQDQSQIPGFPDTEPMWIASRDGAIALNQLVADATAETMYFLTWGRRSGDPMNDWMYPDFSAMQARLTTGYLAYADATATEYRPVWMAPVGPAFAKIHDTVAAAGLEPASAGNDFYELYSGDGSHPSASGTQLTAYVFYASITGETPVGLPAPGGFDAEHALMLQETAAAVVFDPADAFSFPWEADGSPDIVPTDTADPTDSAEPEDSDDDEQSSDMDESGGATDAPNGTADSSTDPEEESKSSGCAVSAGPTGWVALLVGAIAAIGRRRR